LVTSKGPKEELTGDAALSWLTNTTGVTATAAAPELIEVADLLRQIAARLVTTTCCDWTGVYTTLVQIVNNIELDAEPSASRFAASGVKAYPMGTHPMLGQANPIAPPMTLQLEPEGVLTRVVFGPQYEGYPGSVYGGHVAAAFDAILGIAAAYDGIPVVCENLIVLFDQATPINQPVILRARIHGRQRQSRVDVAGELTCLNGVVTVRAEASFRQIQWDNVS
jgi:hypothetical protein